MTAASLGAVERHVETLRSIRDNEYMPHDEHGGFAMEREALDAAIAALTPAAGGADEVPRGVWEALQRMIEDGLLRGPGSAEDARLVAHWRGRFTAAPAPPPAATRLPAQDTTRPTTEQGLFRKFDVRRVDGSDAPGGKHAGCEYFVLDVSHDPAAPAALVAYADAVEATHPHLARDLRSRCALSAPPPADAVRALVGKWRGYEASYRAIGKAQAATVSAAFIEELEEALSAAPAVCNCGARTTGDADQRRHDAACTTYAAAPTPEGRDSETVLPCDLTLTDVWTYHRDRTTASGLTPDARTRHGQMAGVIHRALTQPEPRHDR